MMDCKNARILLQVAHPLATELDAADKQELATHLADCPECGPWAENEHRLDDHFGTAMQALPVPADLSQRLLGRLRVERHLWYKVRILRAAGAAAVLLMAAWLIWVLWWNKKSAPDLDELNYDANNTLYTSQLVEEWFAYRGIAMKAPLQFNYQLLESQGLRDFQGKQVPYLVFFYGGDKDWPASMAEVFVLSSQQFNLAEIPQQAAAAGKKKVMILRNPEPDQQNCVYVVVYSIGTPLEVFFLNRNRPA
jgi:hypothetical protein